MGGRVAGAIVLTVWWARAVGLTSAPATSTACTAAKIFFLSGLALPLPLSAPICSTWGSFEAQATMSSVPRESVVHRSSTPYYRLFRSAVALSVRHTREKKLKRNAWAGCPRAPSWQICLTKGNYGSPYKTPSPERKLWCMRGFASSKLKQGIRYVRLPRKIRQKADDMHVCDLPPTCNMVQALLYRQYNTHPEVQPRSHLERVSAQTHRTPTVAQSLPGSRRLQLRKAQRELGASEKWRINCYPRRCCLLADSSCTAYIFVML